MTENEETDGSLLETMQRATEGRLPGLFGLRLHEIRSGYVRAGLDIEERFLAPTDYLHAGAVVTLADSCCGMGCMASLPEGTRGFTTVELKTNFLRTAGAGETLSCEARLVHGGRTTQVWDAVVRRERDGEDLALFRCTQYLLAEGRGSQEELSRRL